ncbi:hypothetical protein [Carboxydothermus ferrireducens]|uniref:Ogr/Delta-like zinc finger n=1 Tax=Carboxydothermus ferrireducens DSM 11255 TaxID=1119529 RepID=A0ABX2R946_9THEO|nr:hypothetical protein [Carboxydothermus ferrireducens]NYE57455.1 hypothetical protein [Carboxydothermus ferrireducens DSM 11255]
MVVFPEKEVTLRCPACQKNRQLKISVFSLKKREKEDYFCACGLKLLTIRLLNLEETVIRLYFYDDSEIKSFRLKEFVALDFSSVTPKNNGLSLKPRRSYDPLKDENFLKEYFVAPAVMYELLSHLEGLDYQGKIQCECNNFKGELELFPEYLILRCQNCQRAKIFWATQEEDVLKLGQKAILLTTVPKKEK